MISLTGILSLLSALAATGYALSCIECMSRTSSSCSGSNVPCHSGYQCGSEYTEATFDGSTVTTIVRSCLPFPECDIKGSISLLEGKFRFASSCCNTDDCAPTIPSFPTQSSDPNGVVCPSCISADSTWCYTPDTVQCTGNETMCLLVTSKTTGLKSAIRGCATKPFCDLGSQSYSIEGVPFEEVYTCTNNGISLHTVVLTPIIAFLLLLKKKF